MITELKAAGEIRKLLPQWLCKRNREKNTNEDTKERPEDFFKLQGCQRHFTAKIWADKGLKSAWTLWSRRQRNWQELYKRHAAKRSSTTQSSMVRSSSGQTSLVIYRSRAGDGAYPLQGKLKWRCSVQFELFQNLERWCCRKYLNMLRRWKIAVATQTGKRSVSIPSPKKAMPKWMKLPDTLICTLKVAKKQEELPKAELACEVMNF